MPGGAIAVPPATFGKRQQQKWVQGMQTESDGTAGRPLVSTRALEIVVALLFLGGASIFLFDSVRLGFGWQEGQGPAAGYFPFYIALIMAIASLVNLVRAAVSSDSGFAEPATTVQAFGRVLTVLGPALVYVALIGGIGVGPIAVPALGIYVASAIFIIAFMLMFGGEGIVKSVLVGIGIPLFFFFIFEKWFLVPLPKGPLEVYLGLA